LQQGLSFIISIFLARLLAPADFGLIAMSLVVISMFQVFADFGFASALINNKHNTSITYSSIFYFNIVVGVLLFIIFQFSAPAIGKFYKNEIVTELVRWLSFYFIIGSVNLVQRTILKRNIEFKKLTIRTIIAQVIGGIIGVVMAIKGFGVYALVAQNLSAALINTIILWRIAEWHPKLEFSWSEIKKLTPYSAFIFFDNLLNVFFNRLDIIFIGKFFSATTLGYYSRADSVTGLIERYSSASVNKVFFPFLSRVEHNEEFLKIYFKVVSIICFIAFGLGGILLILSHEIITILFGSKWEPSVIMFQILIFRAVLYPVSSMMITAFLSRGKSRENFWIGILRKAGMLLPFIAGYYYGLLVFLMARVGMSFILTTANVLFSERIIGASFTLHFRKIFEGAVVLLFFTMCYYLFLQDSTALIRVLGVIAYLGIYILFNWWVGNEGLIYLRKELFVLLNKIRTTFHN